MLVGWLRNRVVAVLCDLLCLVLPRDKQFTLIVEPVDGDMIAMLKADAQHDR